MKNIYCAQKEMLTPTAIAIVHLFKLKGGLKMTASLPYKM